jgi:hypothetical protein
MSKLWKKVICDDEKTLPTFNVSVMIYKKRTGPIIKLAAHEDFLMEDKDEVIYWRYLDCGDFPPT